MEHLDGGGNTYSADLLPATITVSGVEFDLGPKRMVPAMWSPRSGQTIALPVGNASSVKILAAATNGNKSGNFTVNYSDSTGTTVNLSVTDWCAAGPAFGETVANTLRPPAYSRWRMIRTRPEYTSIISLPIPVRLLPGSRFPMTRI